jgi:hypothetical protein
MSIPPQELRAKELLSIEKAPTAIFTLRTLLTCHHFDKCLDVANGMCATTMAVRAISGETWRVIVEDRTGEAVFMERFDYLVW